MGQKSLHIHKRFPGKIHAIKRLMAEKPSFRSLCWDYEICIKALKHWAQSQAPEAKMRLVEYEMLAKELEEEIQQEIPEILIG